MDSIKIPGLKITKQRTKIYEILDNCGTQLTADEIFAKTKEFFPKIALTTVYRNLEVLCENQLINRVMYHDGVSRYEVAGKNKKPCRILYCKSCKGTFSVNACPVKNKVIREEIKKEAELIYEKTGFVTTSFNVEIYGYCSECAKKIKTIEEDKIK